MATTACPLRDLKVPAGPGLTLSQHYGLGEKCREVAKRLSDVRLILAEAYDERSPEGRAAKKACESAAALRDVLEARLLKDYEGPRSRGRLRTYYRTKERP